MNKLKDAISDVGLAFKEYYLWTTLGWYDVLARYRRSTLGPFWITLSMAITISAMGPLYGSLFGHDMSDFVPHLALGMIFWALISSSINDFCGAFAEAAHYLKQTKISPVVFILRVLHRQFIIFLHNFLLYPVILLIFWKPISLDVLLILPAFFITMINLFWIGIVISIFCTRYRDMLPVINSIITLLFFVTPIIWSMEQLPEDRRYLALWNPFAILLDLLRTPLLGGTPDPSHWISGILIALGGLIFAFFVFMKTRHRITYWL
ncbi:ABC transporter permease [Spirabiliibacterium falconis]|uniref:ABC transporter permease n=1 Tax=Spirabiliibacterium falconis TaxID=572023 RepID=UPI001AACB0CE|nr:ABC transporter permease [Spirabiliibacterium falconis]MBE2894789.1 ABC transporter permease [Spirabiliibacterium falconis]